MAQFVGLDEMAAELGQRFAHEALAAREPAGESDFQHERSEPRVPRPRTVLTISMAMVSGPTPPGTGV